MGNLDGRERIVRADVAEPRFARRKNILNFYYVVRLFCAGFLFLFLLEKGDEILVGRGFRRNLAPLIIKMPSFRRFFEISAPAHAD